jgi:hypothetical protein
MAKPKDLISAKLSAVISPVVHNESRAAAYTTNLITMGNKRP